MVFTVARVPAAVTFPEPSNVGDVYVKSPVIEMVRPVCNAVAVPALPLTEPVIVCRKVLKSERSVEDAAVIVLESPKLKVVPLTVMLELASAPFGKLSVEEAATNGIPVAPRIKKPLLPIPKVVVVLKIVEMFGEVPPLENNGLVAVTAVIEPTGVPQAPAMVVSNPPTPAWTQFPDVRDETDRFPFIVEEAEISSPFAEPLIRFGTIKVSERFVMLHGALVIARAVAGRKSSVAKRILGSHFIISTQKY